MWVADGNPTHELLAGRATPMLTIRIAAAPPMRHTLVSILLAFAAIPTRRFVFAGSADVR